MKIIKQIVDYIKATKYNIGFVQEDLQSVVNGAPIHVDWLKNFGTPVFVYGLYHGVGGEDGCFFP